MPSGFIQSRFFISGDLLLLVDPCRDDTGPLFCVVVRVCLCVSEFVTVCLCLCGFVHICACLGAVLRRICIVTGGCFVLWRLAMEEGVWLAGKNASQSAARASGVEHFPIGRSRAKRVGHQIKLQSLNPEARGMSGPHLAAGRNFPPTEHNY